MFFSGKFPGKPRTPQKVRKSYEKGAGWRKISQWELTVRIRHRLSKDSWPRTFGGKNPPPSALTSQNNNWRFCEAFNLWHWKPSERRNWVSCTEAAGPQPSQTDSQPIWVGEYHGQRNRQQDHKCQSRIDKKGLFIKMDVRYIFPALLLILVRIVLRFVTKKNPESNPWWCKQLERKVT